tara:strand:- start:427 stop:627 length:201 start_codon:yes stop_codon:yes gene_type:complete
MKGDINMTVLTRSATHSTQVATLSTIKRQRIDSISIIVSSKEGGDNFIYTDVICTILEFSDPYTCI